MRGSTILRLPSIQVPSLLCCSLAFSEAPLPKRSRLSGDLPKLSRDRQLSSPSPHAPIMFYCNTFFKNRNGENNNNTTTTAALGFLPAFFLWAMHRQLLGGGGEWLLHLPSPVGGGGVGGFCKPFGALLSNPPCMQPSFILFFADTNPCSFNCSASSLKRRASWSPSV